MHLRIGQQISAPFLSAPAEVKSFEARSGYYKLEVLLQDGSNRFQSHNIFEHQLAQIHILDSNPGALAADAESFFYLVEAHRIRLAYQFDPHLAVSISQVDPLPHQIEAVYDYALQSPRIRFLIADDPGAGKTVMAGLIFKELQYRRLARRVLIVAPGHLKYQWQREMKEKFGTTFAIVDRARIESSWGENAWEERDHCVTSIDFVKQDQVRNTLRGVQWDLVIVDEAHKMSAYAYPGSDGAKIDKTKRYHVGETLSAHSNHLLFLTATPHRGSEENFRLFLDLLRPGFFAQTELLRESVEDKDNPLFIRRLKEDMMTFDGRRIFPPRHVRTVPFRLTEEELALYNDVTRYVQDYFDRAKENRSISFALMILQRRLTSSSHAILRSLVRRKDRLEELLNLPERIRGDEDYLRARNMSEDDIADLSEEDREEIERRLEHLTIARNIEDVRVEIAQVSRLIEKAESVRKREIESKLTGLRDHVLAHLGDQKLLIFTEFRDTLEYLVEKLRGWGYRIITIHGQMNMDARIAAEHEFRDHAQILVATEAAGEGINLQFCSWMVNYDIPWNPNRLEQRMGRIHRYGQQYEVYIWNMITQDTREGQILERLFHKLDQMRQDLGSDRVFDIIGEMIPGARLDDLLKDAIFNQRRMEEIEGQIDAIEAGHARQTLERAFLTSLATRHIDYTGVLRDTLEAEENRLVPEYVEDFFLRAFRHLGGRISRREDGTYNVSSVPYELRRWGDDYNFKNSYGQLFREYKRITFDKRYAREHPEVEFVAPGHPLLEAVNQQILETLRQTQGSADTYAVFGDPTNGRQGVLWFVEGEVSDGAGTAAGKRVFCLYQPAGKNNGDGIRQVNPAILWDHQPLTDVDVPPVVADLLQHRAVIEDYLVTEVLLPFQQEIQERRDRETDVKRKYGLRSLDYLIQESNGKILDYDLRQSAGEAVDLPLLNERRNLESLQQRKEEQEREIEQERNLTIGAPRILGAAAVVPIRETRSVEPTPMDGSEPEAHVAGAGEGIYLSASDREEAASPAPDATKERGAAYEVITGGANAPMQRDDEIEEAGMRVAMQYERDAGWDVEDVAGENHGFDLRSLRWRADGSLAAIRYIEVKARARSGEVRITANEWKKARRYGDDYWLYIVTDAGSDHPQLHRLQNPEAHFRLDEEIFVTGFKIPEEHWRRQVDGET